MNNNKYIVFYYASKGYIEYKTITEPEYQQYVGSIKYVLFYHKFQELFELVKINVFEFWSYLNDVSEKHRLNFIFADYNDVVDPILFTNQKISNILSSFKTFEDHLKHQLSLLFGSDNKILEGYNKGDKAMYDKYFGYRLFKRLRNYTQHYGLPIRTISFSRRGQSKNCKLEIYSVSPLMNKKELLQYKGWSSLKDEINNLADSIDIREYVNEFFHAFKLIFKEVQEILSTKYIISKAKLDQLYNECLIHSADDIDKYKALSLAVYIKANSDDKDKLMLPKDTINRIDRFELRNISNSNIKDSVSFSLKIDNIPL
ncbi:MAG: hypothetical protein P4L45_14575 [Ignavibacteriaceae bacterium]|nr:hypothetical protein [Ignavibacteriaceae bacterium]